MKLIVVVTCSNSSKHLAEILSHIPRKIRGFQTVETLLVDDHSADASVAIAKNLRVDHLIVKRATQGPSAAYVSGVKQALRLGADVVVTLKIDRWRFPDNLLRAVTRPIIDTRATVIIARNNKWWWRFGITITRFGTTGEKSSASTDSTIQLDFAHEVVTAATREMLSSFRKISSTYQDRRLQFTVPTKALCFYNYRSDSYSEPQRARRWIEYLQDCRTKAVSAIKRNRTIVYTLLFFLVFYSVVTVIQPKIYSTPEENVRAYFYSLEKREGLSKGLAYAGTTNRTYRTTLIKPRNTVINYRNQVVPADFLGIYIYFYPFLLLGFTGATMYVVYLLLAIVTLWGVYRLATRLFDHKTALIATITTGFFPVFLYWQGHMMPDIPSVGLVLLGCSYYLDYLNRYNKKYWYISLATALMFIGISIRYTNVLLVGIFLLFYLPYRQYRNKQTIQQHLVMALIAALVVLPILLLNNTLYGSPLETGQQLYSGASDVLRTTSVNFVTTFIKYFVDFLGVLLILAVIGAWHLARDTRHARKFVFFAVTYSLLLFCYFSRAADVYGASSDEALLNYSEPRYYLPIFIMLAIMAGYLLAKFINHSRMYYGLLATIITVFCISSFEYKGTGIIPSIVQAKSSHTILTEFSATLPNNAYVFTQLSDRFLFPQFQVVSYYNSGLDPVNLRAEKAAALAKGLINQRQPVYFFWETVSPNVSLDRNYGTFNTYQYYFNKDGLNLHSMRVSGGLYKVARARS